MEGAQDLLKIRSVRPEFFTDVRMAQLSHSARLLYIGLWSYADDEGRGEFLPKKIEGELFPHESVEFGVLWGELEELGRVVVYESDGQSYFHIPTFSNHQKPNRIYESRLPAPSRRSKTAAAAQDASSAPAPPVEGEGVVEGKGEVAAAHAGFELFHKERCRRLVAERKRKGLKVKSDEGLAYSMSQDPEQRAESWRVYGHKDCSNCRGKGSIDLHAPGGDATINCPGEEQ